MYKFRSMHHGASEDAHRRIRHQHDRGRDRVDRDRLVRRRVQAQRGRSCDGGRPGPAPHSLDELPQLINVLRGEMSLVGPRPPLPYEVEHYEPLAARPASVRPGITGLWQVSGRNRLSYAEMCELDIAYVRDVELRRRPVDHRSEDPVDHVRRTRRSVMRPAFGVGVIGCGYWGPNLIRNFARHDGASVVAVCDMQARARHEGGALVRRADGRDPDPRSSSTTRRSTSWSWRRPAVLVLRAREGRDRGGQARPDHEADDDPQSNTPRSSSTLAERRRPRRGGSHLRLHRRGAA